MIVLFLSHATERDGLFEFPEYLTSVRYFTSRGAEQLTFALLSQTVIWPLAAFST